MNSESNPSAPCKRCDAMEAEIRELRAELRKREEQPKCDEPIALNDSTGIAPKNRIAETGWICPVCGGGNSMYSNRCPCVPYSSSPSYAVHFKPFGAGVKD